MTARTFVVTIAIALVIVFHFASELTALVTALGFAAAGIAFALQTRDPGAGGLFAILSPNGNPRRRRVSLQGPFRVRVRRGRGDRLRADPAARARRRASTPTGRIVVTGPFSSIPPGEEAEPLRRSA